MSSSDPLPSTTRDRLLDAAASVLRDRGAARVTTKEIARAAGCSEALLYKHFGGKRDLLLAVLRERIGIADVGEEPGTGEVRDTLVETVEGLLAYYAVTLPLTMSLLASSELLAAWHGGATERGTGPRAPIRALETYLQAEIDLGRVDRTVDPTAVATLLSGGAFQQAFLAVFDGLPGVPDARQLAERLVDAAIEL